MNDKTILDWALKGIYLERATLDALEADLRRRLTGSSPKAATRITATSSASLIAPQRIPPNKGKTMSKAQRKKISKSMKARWAGKTLK